MVAMPVRNNGEIELGKVDALGFHVLRKDVGVVTGIKEDALAAIFNQRGKPPVLLHRR